MNRSSGCCPTLRCRSWASLSRRIRRTNSKNRLTLPLFSSAPGNEYLFQSAPEARAGGFSGLRGSRYEHRHIRAIDDAPGQIAHDVMPEGPTRLGRAGHDQVVLSFADFRENLTEDESMAHTHLSRHSEALETLLLREQVATEL